MIVVGSLPTMHDASFYGTIAMPSINGNGAYLQYHKYLYELTCTSSSCTWSVMEQELSSRVSWAVMMHLPSDYNCTN